MVFRNLLQVLDVILSSIFQHKNANLNKNSVFHVRDARQLHFIIRDITCRIACLRTWMTWFLTTAQPFFQSWKPNVIIRRLRCGWIYVQKNVYLTRGKGHSKGACQRGVRFIVHPSVYNWVWEFLNWQSEPHIFFEFSWILTNACGIVVVTKKGGCFNETRIIR